jgi:hypothetical protein
VYCLPTWHLNPLDEWSDWMSKGRPRLARKFLHVDKTHNPFWPRQQGCDWNERGEPFPPKALAHSRASQRSAKPLYTGGECHLLGLALGILAGRETFELLRAGGQSRRGMPTSFACICTLLQAILLSLFVQCSGLAPMGRSPGTPVILACSHPSFFGLNPAASGCILIC